MCRKRLLGAVSVFVAMSLVLLCFSGNALAKHYKNHTVVVDRFGYGDFRTIQDALDSITDASAENPYLINVNAGVYDVGSIALEPYVHLKGSGVDITVLRGSDSVLKSASNSSVSDLSIENEGAGAHSIGIQNVGSKSFLISNVKVTVSGGSNGYYGVYGIYNQNSTVKASGLTINATGGTHCAGIYSMHDYGSTLEVVNASIEASGGTKLVAGVYIGWGNPEAMLKNITIEAASGYALYTDSHAVVTGSELTGPYAIYTSYSRYYNVDGVARVSNSMLDGLIGGSGTASCFNSWDGENQPLDSTCN